ncbi:hypothetical protein PC119_g11497 [Phytophthora cactorum]|nr:hypothetical protein PC119_g11497 [Phytophthora cactorum]
MLAADGIVNANKLVVLRLSPYSPMLNPIEGCWNGTPSNGEGLNESSLASTLDITSTTTSLLPNWCPLNYPVQCGRECIPQSDDCALEVITKIESVAAVALNAATSGVFGQLSTASAAVQQGVKCGQKLVTVVENIVGYAKELQSNFPNGTEEQIISLLNNSDIVVKDLPTAVCICLGLDVPTDYLNLASDVIRKVLSVITDNQIWPSDNDSGKALSTADYILKLDDMGLDVIAMSCVAIAALHVPIQHHEIPIIENETVVRAGDSPTTALELRATSQNKDFVPAKLLNLMLFVP